MIASQQGSEGIVKALLEYKPNLNKRDRFNKTALDKAQNEVIINLLRAAAKEQHNNSEEVNESKSLKPKSLSKSFDMKMTHGDKRQHDDASQILEYYKAYFKRQVIEITEQLSKPIQTKLTQQIERELANSTQLLKTTLYSDFTFLTDKIKEQLNQYITLKIKLVAARSGISITSLNEPLHDITFSLTTQNNTQPLISKEVEMEKEQINYEGKCKDEEGIKKWSKNKRKLYCLLNSQMKEYINKKLEEIAKQINDDTLQRLLFVVEKRLTSFEGCLKKEVTDALVKFTREVKSAADSSISERMVRAEKKLKERLKRERSKIREEYIRVWAEEKNKVTLDQNLFDIIRGNTSGSNKSIKKEAFKFPDSSISSLRASKECLVNQSFMQPKVV